MKVFVAATERSLPPCVSNVSSTMPVMEDPGSLVMPTVYAPECRALSSTRLMSSPSPDCDTPTTSAWSSFKLRVVDRVNGRRGKRDRNPGGDFKQVAAKERRVIGAAARDEYDQMNVARLQRRCRV